ncbi:MAG TPA: sugar-binding domain-containing protein [Candidatus Limnocylindrales bacterium]|nr:sugar-binding domain-containing protein [Candidatus Limnocylindrales bacterium]
MSDHALLVRASRLYYELGETQEQVAERLGVTRAHVSKLLKQARAAGVVEIRIVDRLEAPSPAADELRERFDLRAVHLAAGGGDAAADLARRRVGRLAAQVLMASVRDGLVVGIGDGSAVSATADAVEAPATPIDATVVPLCGGYWQAGAAREPFRRIADAIGAAVHGLLAPGLLDDAATRDALMAHAGVRAVAELWDRLDVALFGIGGPAWSEVTLGRDVAAELAAGRAVGETLIAPFDVDGRFVGEQLRSRTIAFDARRLAGVPLTIAVAEGGAKVQPILGALRAGIVKVLVSDLSTAEAVLALDRRAAA